MKPPAALLRRSLRSHQIYGANTEVGKTIITTTLARAAHRRFPHDAVSYLKPVSTGPDNEADGLPHSAAPPSGLPIPSDASLLHAISAHAAAAPPGWLFVETAGGVHSPGPSGTTQAELFKPLRLPVVLVGDAKLGGISQTISAYESLLVRGYDVEAVLLFREMRYRNYDFLREYFAKRGVVVDTVEPPPARLPDQKADEHMMREFYAAQAQAEGPQAVLERLTSRHMARLERLDSMASAAHKSIWYPFTQQSLVSRGSITAIDSAHGNYFQTLRAADADTDAKDTVLQPSFDGSASWWTQGLGHADTDLALAAAYAAGRYGHVMFAEAIHEPALQLAETLLAEASVSASSSAPAPAQPPSRLFYTDNGSSGCEVAVKMALRAARTRYGWSPHDKIDILGLVGSYHGDTMGVMDCADPNAYNEKVEWYTGRGYWFDAPTVLYTRDGWGVGENRFASLQEVFDVEMRERRGDAAIYEKEILAMLTKLRDAGRKFGALVMEPVVLGAGGMKLVDPLFQRTLVRVVRSNPQIFGPDPGPTSDPTSWSGLPVLFDEVFTGLFRLGRFSASSFLGVYPDIVVNAKLLTGGALPLCTTMASEAIFNSFLSADKSDALLHGHSYTAHAMGCQVALKSVRELKALDEGGAWEVFKRDWSSPDSTSASSASPTAAPSASASPASVTSTAASPWSAWPSAFIHNLPSSSPSIHGVWALGSVLALTLRDSSSSGSGYKSTASLRLHKTLLRTLDGWNVHNRVLGNVLYLMVGQRTTVDEMTTLCERVKTAIAECDAM